MYHIHCLQYTEVGMTAVIQCSSVDTNTLPACSLVCTDCSDRRVWVHTGFVVELL